MTTSVSFQANIAVTRTIEHMPINERLIAVRVSQNGELLEPTNIAQKRFANVLTAHKSEMVLTPANLDKLLAGKPYTSENLTAVSETFLEDARTKGYPDAVDIHSKTFVEQGANYLTRLESGEALRMVNVDYASHMLFDDEGHVLPTGLCYEYTRGNMRDGAYDLAKVIEVLKGLPDVYVPDGKPLATTPVPYYNLSAGCTESLSFVYGPTKEQMQVLWEKAKTLNKKYPSTVLHHAAFDLDLMGLRKAGAARYDNFYETYSGDSDNDD